MSHCQKESTEGVEPIVEDKNRRRVVKGIVCGLTAFTAYNVLPSKWGTPIIEQVFLPAHAATSGVLLSGNFSGTGIIDLVSIGKRQQQNGLIAKVGTSIGDFLVSEVHADELMRVADHRFHIDCCTSIEGEFITYYLTTGVDGCHSISARLAEVATYTGRFDRVFTLKVIEKGQDSIRISLTLNEPDEPGEPGESYTTTLTLDRSEDVCKCPEHIGE
ncbi:MAG: hypothetical protein COA36_12570 [Desulfotalea sp.]|nr:MAG: hypothetical protein COA36_12570 [Desulfotalea sp.]